VYWGRSIVHIDQIENGDIGGKRKNSISLMKEEGIKGVNDCGERYRFRMVTVNSLGIENARGRWCSQPLGVA